MNYFVITLLTNLFYAQYFGNIEFCAALMLDGGDPCKDPVEACEELGDGFLVYNPTDCHQSYACITDYTGNVVPSDDPLTCSDGLTFDYENQNCSSKITSCDKACVNKACIYECRADTSRFVADINDCNVYYFCYGGITSPDSCPDSDPYFDGNECTNKEYLCCDACAVYCANDDNGNNITDPYDCTAFYSCEGYEGIPDESLHFHCDEGEYFDSDVGECADSTETCENICDHISTTAITSTTTTVTRQSATTTETTNSPSTSGHSSTKPSTSESSTTETSPTKGSTTEASPTKGSTTEASPTKGSTTEASPTKGSTTEASPTKGSTTEESSTKEPTTEESLTTGSTTEESPTKEPTTESLPTKGSTTEASPTTGSTTEASPTKEPTTEEPPTKGSTTEPTTYEPLSTETESTSEKPSPTNPGPK